MARVEDSGLAHLASNLMVSGAGHVWLPPSDGSQLSVELFQDCFESVFPVKEIFGFLEPVVSLKRLALSKIPGKPKRTVCQISWMNNEFVVIDCPCKTVDRGMVERRINRRNDVALRLISLDSESIGTIDTKIYDSVDRKRRLVTRRPWAEEMLH